MRMVDMFTDDRNENKYADYTVAVDGETIPVHRCILAQHSHYFQRLFATTGTVEAANNCLTITDFSSVTVRTMLKFIYTGAVGSVDVKGIENKEALLRIAEKYQLDGLKEIMEHCLAKEVNAQNFFHLAAVSDMYSAKVLKKACALHLAKYSSSIVNSGQWNELRRQRASFTSDLLEKALLMGSVIMSESSARTRGDDPRMKGHVPRVWGKRTFGDS